MSRTMWGKWTFRCDYCEETTVLEVEYLSNKVPPGWSVFWEKNHSAGKDICPECLKKKEETTK